MQSVQSRSLIKQFSRVVAIACILVITFTVLGAYSLINHSASILTLSEKKSEAQSALELIEQTLYDYLLIYIDNNNVPDKAALTAIDQRFTEQANNARETLSPALIPHLKAIEDAWLALRQTSNAAYPNIPANSHMSNYHLRNQLTILKETALAQIKQELDTQYTENKWIFAQVFIGALIGLALSVWLVMKLIMRISDSLHKLGQGIAIAAVGDLSQRVDIHGCSEIEALSEGFNYMVSELDRQNTEVMESEQSLLAVMNSAPDAIITTDLNGNIDSWNQAAEQMFAYSLNDMSGQAFQAILDPNQQTNFQRLLTEYRDRSWVDNQEPEGPP